MHREIKLDTPSVFRVIVLRSVKGRSTDPYPMGPYVDLGVAKRVLSKERNKWNNDKERFPEAYTNIEIDFYIEESPLVWTRVT